MKQFRIFKYSNVWSTATLRREVENEINNLSNDGYEIVSVSFGFNMWFVPTAFVTVFRNRM
ncbi:MAG: hypothetical protein ACOVMM_07375 [Chitinophagaceae bacterium]